MSVRNSDLYFANLPLKSFGSLTALTSGHKNKLGMVAHALNPSIRRQRQWICEFEASMVHIVYIVNSRTARTPETPCFISTSLS